MDVALSEEQDAWREATGRLADAHAVTGADHVPPGGWDDVVALGIPALRSPEHAGTEAAGVESALAVEAVARRLCALPVTGQAVLAPHLLHAAGATEALDAVVGGTLRLTVALDPALTGLGRLGEPAIALDARDATHALVLDGDRLAAVALAGTRATGLDLTRELRPVDARPAAGDLAVALGGPLDEQAADRFAALALTALAADVLGVLGGAIEEAVAYARDRRQFGVPIGSFQAVQHLLADALVQAEGIRGCVWYAAWAGDHEPVPDALLAARVAKAAASELGLRVAEACVQVFGGIAITWEHLSHLRLRRVLLDRAAFGDERVQHLAIARHRTGAGRVA